jgi:hypothetical protein
MEVIEVKKLNLFRDYSQCCNVFICMENKWILIVALKICISKKCTSMQIWKIKERIWKTYTFQAESCTPSHSDLTSCRQECQYELMRWELI